MCLRVPFVQPGHVETNVLDVMLRRQELIQIIDILEVLVSKETLVTFLLAFFHQIQHDDRCPVSAEQLIEVFAWRIQAVQLSVEIAFKKIELLNTCSLRECVRQI